VNLTEKSFLKLKIFYKLVSYYRSNMSAFLVILSKGK